MGAWKVAVLKTAQGSTVKQPSRDVFKHLKDILNQLEFTLLHVNLFLEIFYENLMDLPYNLSSPLFHRFQLQ